MMQKTCRPGARMELWGATALVGGVALMSAPAFAQKMMGQGMMGQSMMDKGMMSRAMMRKRMMAKPDPSMKQVLDMLKALGAKPINTLTVRQARLQPTPSEAVKTILRKRGMSFPEPVGSVMDKVLPTMAGPVRVRVYKPKNMAMGPLPVTMYFHGGGFVIASISTYDSSCRAIANAANTMVVAVAYPLAPEKKLPAAHEACYAATQYVIKNAASMGGDPKRVAVMGESAGGNLATDMCLMARDRKGMMPIYQALIYPFVDATPEALKAPSALENYKAAPLNTPSLAWFGRYALPRPSFARTPLVSPLKYANVRGLPPATVVLAEIDPLRSQGVAYAAKLQKAGIPVRMMLYTGVTHEFYGMGAVVPKAKQAVAFTAAGLKQAFAK